MKKNLIYPTCYRHPNIFRCEFGEQCELDGEPGYCTADWIDTMDPKHIDILRADCINEGYTCAGIEAELLFLNTDCDMDIDGDEKARGSFMHQLKGEKIMPFPGKFTPGKFYHLRASEFGGRCYLAQLISKFRRDFIDQFPVSEMSIAGTTRHEICNAQPEGEDFIHNRTLDRFGSPISRRESYCEQEMEYVIMVDGKQRIIRGHSDGQLRLGDSNAVHDFKRALGGANESPKHRIQLNIYALAREQYNNRMRLFRGAEVIPRDPFILITVKRPFPPAKEGRARRPKFHATRIYRPESRAFYNEFRHTIAESFRAQTALLEYPDLALELIAENRKKNLCMKDNRPCFNIDICERLFDMISSGSDLADFLAPEVRFDKEADDPVALEIEERIQSFYRNL